MSFESLSDQKIQALLTMQKRVTNPTAREVQDAAHDKRDYRVLSDDDSEEFSLFTRQNKKVVDDFSCGLRWLAPGTEGLILVRYNGASHSHPNHLEGDRVDFLPHIHTATERYIQANLRAEGFAIATTQYTTVRGALHALVTDLNIRGLQTQADVPELF